MRPHLAAGTVVMRLYAAVRGAILAVALIEPPASAHHGRGPNVSVPSELTGTVERVLRFSPPHPTMQIRVEDQVWDLTIAQVLIFVGLDKASIPVGARVTVRGYRNKDPKRFELWTDRLTWGGRTFQS